MLAEEVDDLAGLKRPPWSRSSFQCLFNGLLTVRLKEGLGCCLSKFHTAMNSQITRRRWSGSAESRLSACHQLARKARGEAKDSLDWRVATLQEKPVSHHAANINGRPPFVVRRTVGRAHSLVQDLFECSSSSFNQTSLLWRFQRTRYELATIFFSCSNEGCSEFSSQVTIDAARRPEYANPLPESSSCSRRCTASESPFENAMSNL